MHRSIAIIDYNVSNLHSIVSALKYVTKSNTHVFVTNKAQETIDADALVFPGQGAAKICMQSLNTQPELVASIKLGIKEKPFLGICMGLQVLFEFSEENGGIDCLGVLPGIAKSFDEQTVKVPHMGWNTIKQREHRLWHGVPDNSYFYFVHSYFINSSNQKQVAGTTTYGVDFSSAVMQDNFFAIQAHPEKSGDVGLQLLSNFCEWQSNT